MLLETLIREGCPSLLDHKREVRAIKNPEVKLKAEMQTYERLTDELVACQADIAKRSRPSMKSITTPTTTRPTTTTPTTKTPTTTSQTTTTPTTTTTTTSPPPTTTPVTTTSFKPLPTECVTAMNLTEAWRKDYSGSSIKPIDGKPNCDLRGMATTKPWFRFTGAAGTKLLDHCVPGESCGSHIALWSDMDLPSKIGVVYHYQVYGSFAGNCKVWEPRCSVMRCSSQANDVIYRYDHQDRSCSNGFCGMD